MSIDSLKYLLRGKMPQQKLFHLRLKIELPRREMSKYLWFLALFFELNQILLDHRESPLLSCTRKLKPSP